MNEWKTVFICYLFNTVIIWSTRANSKTSFPYPQLSDCSTKVRTKNENKYNNADNNKTNMRDPTSLTVILYQNVIARFAAMPNMNLCT